MRRNNNGYIIKFDLSCDGYRMCGLDHMQPDSNAKGRCVDRKVIQDRGDCGLKHRKGKGAWSQYKSNQSYEKDKLMASKKATAKSKQKAPTSKSQEALSEIKTHQRECAIRYEFIEKRLDEGSEKFKKLEMMIWGVYPFMVATIVAAKYL